MRDGFDAPDLPPKVARCTRVKGGVVPGPGAHLRAPLSGNPVPRHVVLGELSPDVIASFQIL